MDSRLLMSVSSFEWSVTKEEKKDHWFYNFQKYTFYEKGWYDFKVGTCLKGIQISLHETNVFVWLYISDFYDRSESKLCTHLSDTRVGLLRSINVIEPFIEQHKKKQKIYRILHLSRRLLKKNKNFVTLSFPYKT